jgi:hypothetical protein
VQLEHVHAFDDSVARVAVKQAASHCRLDAVTLQNGIVDVVYFGRVTVVGIDARQCDAARPIDRDMRRLPRVRQDQPVTVRRSGLLHRYPTLAVGHQ